MEDGSEATNVNMSSTTEQELYQQCIESVAYLDVLAATSAKADDAYAKKKLPKGHPWPKEHFLNPKPPKQTISSAVYSICS